LNPIASQYFENQEKHTDPHNLLIAIRERLNKSYRPSYLHIDAEVLEQDLYRRIARRSVTSVQSSNTKVRILMPLNENMITTMWQEWSESLSVGLPDVEFVLVSEPFNSDVLSQDAIEKTFAEFFGKTNKHVQLKIFKRQKFENF
jgi:hypothetical protein